MLCGLIDVVANRVGEEPALCEIEKEQEKE